MDGLGTAEGVEAAQSCPGPACVGWSPTRSPRAKVNPGTQGIAGWRKAVDDGWQFTKAGGRSLPEKVKKALFG